MASDLTNGGVRPTEPGATVKINLPLRRKKLPFAAFACLSLPDAGMEEDAHSLTK
jgi:hypothetical protein